METIGGKTFLTQTELCARWNLTKQSIINKANQGLIPVFRLPGSGRPRYPLDEIKKIEKANTYIPSAKEVMPKSVIEGEKPVSGPRWEI